MRRQIGSTLARAVDTTAAIVMKDHNLTDMRDDNRMGETSVPKLPLPQQEKVDNFFNAQNVAKTNPHVAAKVAGIKRAVSAGAFAQQVDTQIVSGVLSNKQKFQKVGEGRL